MSVERYWEAALGQLQMEIPRESFNTWVRDAELISHEDGLYIIGVQNAYARDWLQDRLYSTVCRILTGIVGHTVDVRFIIWQGDFIEEQAQPILPKTSQSGNHNSRVKSNLSYSFDGFIVGPSNRLAHAAAMAVAESPAGAYNPLFLYGGVGLGKTHLLHAIGNACSSAGLQTLYVSSEKFTNDLINAIRTHKTDSFRECYRRIDILLIDDIQFIAGKESTQEEFFHTFNELHSHNKQLVISSDRRPKALVTLEERLCSRFEWGLTADIQPPDFETRMAILRTKAERSRHEVDFRLLEIIARRIKSNIRELEGALNRVLAMSDLNGLPLTSELIESAITDLLPRREAITAQQVIDAVTRQFGVEEERVLSPERSRDVALPRQVAMYLLRQEVGFSLTEVGKALGGRDHTTVMYGCDKIASRLETDDGLRRNVLAARELLYDQVRVGA